MAELGRPIASLAPAVTPTVVTQPGGAVIPGTTVDGRYAGWGWGGFGTILIAFLIIAIIAFIILYALASSVTGLQKRDAAGNPTGEADVGKILVWAIIIGVVGAIIVWLIRSLNYA